MMKRYEKKVQKLEQQNKDLQKENEELKFNLANVSSESAQKLEEDYIQKLVNLEEQLSDLKRKLNSKSQFSSQKVRGDQTTNGLQNQIARIKAQKVELQRKLKEESVQFRLCNALLEKEILQMKKDARRKEFEMRDLLALNDKLKTVSQRKIEEANVATNRLNELLLSRNGFSRKNSGIGNGKGPKNQRSMRPVEAEVKVPLIGVRSEYVRQVEELAMITKEVTGLKQEAEILKQRNLKCIVDDIEVDCQEKDLEIENLVREVTVDSKQKDLEIKALKEQISNMKHFVTQLEQKPAHVPSKTTQDLTPRVAPVESKSPISTKFIGSNSELSDATNTSEAKESTEISISKEKSASGLCCSCSKKSLCKTTKCKCLSAGGSCGASCGCAPTKCSNREKVLVKADESPQSNVTDENSGTNNTDTKVLAARGVALLQSALVDKPAETKESIDSERKPLSDLQNTLIPKDAAAKPTRKKRVVKP